MSTVMGNNELINWGLVTAKNEYENKFTGEYEAVKTLRNSSMDARQYPDPLSIKDYVALRDYT